MLQSTNGIGTGDFMTFKSGVPPTFSSESLRYCLKDNKIGTYWFKS